MKKLYKNSPKIALYRPAVDLSELIALNDLSDVTITNISNGQVLVYNSSTGQWINQDAPKKKKKEKFNVNTSLIASKQITLIFSPVTDSEKIKMNGLDLVNDDEPPCIYCEEFESKPIPEGFDYEELKKKYNI